MCANLGIKPMLYIILMKNHVLQICDTFRECLFFQTVLFFNYQS
jgi:hypothetical protein